MLQSIIAVNILHYESLRIRPLGACATLDQIILDEIQKLQSYMSRDEYPIEISAAPTYLSNIAAHGPVVPVLVVSPRFAVSISGSW